MSPALSWREAQPIFSAPCFSAVSASLGQLRAEDWPSLHQLNGLAEDRQLRNLAGMPLRFVAGTVDEPAGVHYETRISLRGEVLTRPIWHDLFNALQWLTLPKSKAAISAAHAALLDLRGADEARDRSVPRDVLTLFDEGGIIVCAADPALLQLIRDFRWQELFVQRRAELIEKMRFHLVGHSVLEKMLVPFVGITAKALLVAVEPDHFKRSLATQLASLDQVAADWLQDPANLTSTRALHPLPVLGIPGWDRRNASPDFYDNTDYFRAGYSRQRKPAPG